MRERKHVGKRTRYSAWTGGITLALLCVQPTAYALSALAGWTWDVRCPAAQAAALCALLLVLLARPPLCRSRTAKLAALLGPAIVLIDHILHYLMPSGHAGIVPLGAAALIACPLALRVLRRNRRLPLFVRGMGVLLALLLTFLSVGLTGLHLLFQDFGHEDVWHTASPDGAYQAQIRVVDEGALGGDTLITVWRSTDVISLGIGTARRQKVLQTEWIRPEDMHYEWTDNAHIAVCGEVFDVRIEAASD